MGNIPKTRASLILRLPQADDASAWQEFTEIYEPFVYRFARRRGLQHADATELTQEVFLAVAKAVGRYKIDPERAQFRTWLFRIARNCVLKMLAKKRDVLALDDSSWQEVADSAFDDSVAEQEELMEFRREVFTWATTRVKKMVRPNTWKAFWETAVEGKSIQDVADDLDIAVGAVYVSRSRVINRLREEIEHFESGVV